MNSESATTFESRAIACTRMGRRIRCLCVTVLFMPGCSAPTEVDRDNRRLVDAILTAITMKNAKWLEEDAELAEKRHDAGQLTDADYDELLIVIEQGRAGDWKVAEQKGYEFRKQHPYVKEGH